MSAITFTLAEVFIVIDGGKLLSIVNLIKVIFLIILSVISSSSMMFFIVSFFKSHSAYSTASIIIGTMIGFLTGIYIPIGGLGKNVQFIIKIFPISHSGALIRQVMLEKPMAESFANNQTGLETFKLEMGVLYKFGNHTISMTTSILILLTISAILYVVSILRISKKER